MGVNIGNITKDAFYGKEGGFYAKGVDALAGKIGGLSKDKWGGNVNRNIAGAAMGAGALLGAAGIGKAVGSMSGNDQAGTIAGGIAGVGAAAMPFIGGKGIAREAAKAAGSGVQSAGAAAAKLAARTIDTAESDAIKAELYSLPIGSPSPGVSSTSTPSVRSHTGFPTMNSELTGSTQPGNMFPKVSAINHGMPQHGVRNVSMLPFTTGLDSSVKTPRSRMNAQRP